MAGLPSSDGPGGLNCVSRPCPFCAIGMRHDVLKDDVVSWWRRRCLDFLLDTDAQGDGPWLFFIHAMAVRSIMRGPPPPPPSEIPPAQATATKQNGSVENSAGTCVGGSPGSSGLAPVQAPQSEHTGPLPTRGNERAEHWQYRGGKQGAGSWRWMDAETSRRLEDAYLAGRDSLVLPAEEGWKYLYDFRTMTQTSIPTGDDAPTTRAVQRVTDVHEV